MPDSQTLRIEGDHQSTVATPNKPAPSSGLGKGSTSSAASLEGGYESQGPGFLDLIMRNRSNKKKISTDNQSQVESAAGEGKVPEEVAPTQIHPIRNQVQTASTDPH